jgi:porin
MPSHLLLLAAILVAAGPVYAGGGLEPDSDASVDLLTPRSSDATAMRWPAPESRPITEGPAVCFDPADGYGDMRLLPTISLGALQDGTETAPAEPSADAAATGHDDFWTRDKCTGDWWGARTTLEQHGISLGLRLSQYYQHVVDGGFSTGGEYGGTVDYRLNVDAGKLFGAEGLSFDLHARTRFGRDVNTKAGPLVLENTGMLMPLPGDYEGTDITGLTVNQMFPVGEDHLGQFTLGKLDVLDAVTLFFPSVGYGQEGFWNVNSMVTALPWFGAVNGLSLYGGWLASINEEYQMGQSAILVTGTQNVTTEWSSVSDSFDDVWIAAFHRFLWKWDDKTGYFMVFAGYSTRSQSSNDPHDFVFIPGQGIESTDEKEPWDVALYLYQDFWHAEGDPSRKANFMIGGTVGPDNPQFAQWNLFANVEAYGLIESRPHDRAGIAGWYSGLSGNYKDLTSDIGIDVQDVWGAEVYYNYEVTPWFHLTGDLQIVQGAIEDNDAAVILGLRAVLDF